MLGKAIKIASDSFENIKDKGGRPYILHCLWVMDKVRHLGEKYMIVAVLHDLVEDTNWTISMLANEGFNDETLTALSLLDFTTTKSYQGRIVIIKNNPIAKEVKMRDIEHNSKITRLKGIGEKDLIRMKKYHKAYQYLKN